MHAKRLQAILYTSMLLSHLFLRVVRGSCFQACYLVFPCKLKDHRHCSGARILCISLFAEYSKTAKHEKMHQKHQGMGL